MAITKKNGNPVALPWIPTNGSVPVAYSDAIFDINKVKEDGTPYNQAEINALVLAAIDGMSGTGLSKQIVDALPAVADGKENVIYMVKKTADGDDYYDEYMFIPAAGEVAAHFEPIGSTKVDLSDYYTKGEIDTKLADINAAAGTGIKTVKMSVDGGTGVSLAADGSNAVLDVTSTPATIAEASQEKTLVNVKGLNAAIKSAVDAIPEPDLSNYYTKSETYSKTEVDGKVDTINATLEANAAADTALKGRVDTIETGLTNATTAIQANTADIAAVKGRLNTAESDIDNLETSVAGISDTIDDKIDAAIGENGVIAGAITNALAGYQTKLTFGPNGVVVASDDSVASTITMSLNPTNHHIEIKNSASAVIAEMDASEFLVDGMLNNVVLDGTTLKFTWNVQNETGTGTKEVSIDLGTIIKNLNSIELGAANGIDLTTGKITIAAVTTGADLGVAAADANVAVQNKLTSAKAVSQFVASSIEGIKKVTGNESTDADKAANGLISLNTLISVIDNEITPIDEATIKAAIGAVNVN